MCVSTISVESAHNHHPCLSLCDFASQKAWEAGEVASHNIVLQLCTRAELFDPAVMLEMALSPTRATLQQSALQTCFRIVRGGNSAEGKWS